MTPLAKPLRSRLESAVTDARRKAEAAARGALERLAVDRPEPFGHMAVEARELRVRLRARARQLGDVLLPRTDERGRNHQIDHLVREAAYEWWHRMLFARFLAENHLLMHPSGVAVSLEECKELASEEGAADGWELAGRYASTMLPEIFRPDDPVLAMHLAPEDLQTLEKLLQELPAEVFTADDSLGWVYQFWQAEEKDRVNKSGLKIGADELAAVTQLFTEHYMVEFLLHNSLGAWWAGRKLGSEVRGPRSEEELRKAVALPGVSWDYLRFVEEGEMWRPAAGTFDGWPRAARDLKLLDPCGGSGHFLVAELFILVPMRMTEEGLSAREAVDAVLRDNLHALEIDPRCTQIMAFNLALAAWRYPSAGGYRELPPLNIACCGLAPRAKKEDWLALAGKDERLRDGMAVLYDLFQDAPVLGSLIDPTRVGDMHLPSFSDLQPLIELAFASERSGDADREAHGVTARGIAHAAVLLAGRYHLVATNVPYVGRKRQHPTLKGHCSRAYPAAKTDLATCFLERCLSLCALDGSSALVMPQNWLFLGAYMVFRTKLLRRVRWNTVARLGSHAFEAIGGEVVNVCLIAITGAPLDRKSRFAGLDVALHRDPRAKAAALIEEEVSMAAQLAQMENPDHRITLASPEPFGLLGVEASAFQGVKTGDDQQARRCFFELADRAERWRWYQSTVERTAHFGGLHYLLRWQNAGHDLARLQGLRAWDRSGIAISQMNALPSSVFSGHAFDSNVSPIVPRETSLVCALWCFCSSPRFLSAVRRIDQALKVTNTSLVKVPFDRAHWQAVAAERYPNGLPKPYSDDPTQWIFHGHPCGSVVWDEAAKWTARGPLRTDATVLQVAVARLLGYRWPAELEEMELADEARAVLTETAELVPFGDDDGVVCIPAVGGERPAAERLRELLAAAYGRDWSPGREQALLVAVGYGGQGLEQWLRDGFFEQHCKLFHQRPFVWHVWDGRRDGFSALVHYHRLDRRLLERLAYSYIGDWLTRQQAEAAAGNGPAEARVLAARDLQKRLQLILDGEAPHDIFVRWKPIERQPLGWEPDLDDGVRLNHRPFVQANVLRKRPGIKWDKDRGRDPESAPWYPVFKGDRINDHHLTLAEKRAARENSGAG